MPLRPPRGFIAEDDPKVAPIGHPAPPWLINYADLMTEMVAFFVIMYALGAALNKDVQKAQQEIKEMIDKGEIAGKVEVTKEGMRITMEEGSKDEGKLPFFESGKAEVTSTMDGVLNKLAPMFRNFIEKHHEIIVEGHTDNVPISGGAFPSNWELSTSRAVNVLRYLHDHYGLPPTSMGAVGYGEFRPVAPNDTEENRRKNRRVVFFVKNPPVQKFEQKGKE